MIASQQKELINCLNAIWAPEPDCPVWLWAENNILLSPLESSEHSGNLNTNLTPFIREPLECYRSPEVRECTLAFATQVAKTLLMMLGNAWWLCHKSGRLIWVMDTEHNARSFSKTRWQPLIEESEPLRMMKPAAADDFGNLEQRLGASLVNFVGSNSPGNLASRPADCLVMDEVEKFALESSRESSAVELAEQRTKSRSQAFIMRSSSPSIDTGLLWQSYLMGDQRKYFVPCPHCEQKITLEWENVKWDAAARTGQNDWDMEAVRNTARYICQHCSGKITDGLKVRMLRAGEWQATVNAPRWRRSYHLNSLYSPWTSTTFGNLAVKFLDLKKKFDLKTWDNGYMAMPTSETVDKANPDELAARREPLDLKPPGALVAVAGADTQDDRLEIEILAFGREWESWGLIHHIERGNPGSRGVWDGMEHFLLKMKREAGLARVMWDIGGHHTSEVYAFCQRPKLRGWVLPCQGASQRGAAILKNIKGTRQPKVGLRLFSIGTDTAKTWWSQAVKANAGQPRFMHFDDAYTDEWFRQFSAEEVRRRYVKGRPVEEWHQIRRRNEALDMRVYALAAMIQLGGEQYLQRLARVADRRPEPKEEQAKTKKQKTRSGKPWVSNY